MKEKSGRRVKVLDRNKCMGVGGVFCVVCGKFFDDVKLSTIANFSDCRQHRGKEGYSLIERIEKGD